MLNYIKIVHNRNFQDNDWLGFKFVFRQTQNSICRSLFVFLSRKPDYSE